MNDEAVNDELATGNDGAGSGLLRGTRGAVEPGRHTGVIGVYDDDVGLGTVDGDSGGRWMFHCTAIADGSRSIVPGTRVVFEVRAGGPGRFEAFDLIPTHV